MGRAAIFTQLECLGKNLVNDREKDSKVVTLRRRRAPLVPVHDNRMHIRDPPQLARLKARAQRPRSLILAPGQT